MGFAGYVVPLKNLVGIAEKEIKTAILPLYVIMLVDMESVIIPQRYKSIVDKISITAKENSFDVYIVGGFVRDLFIERSKDLDIWSATEETMHRT